MLSILGAIVIGLLKTGIGLIVLGMVIVALVVFAVRAAGRVLAAFFSGLFGR